MDVLVLREELGSAHDGKWQGQDIGTYEAGRLMFGSRRARRVYDLNKRIRSFFYIRGSLIVSRRWISILQNIHFI